VDQINDSILIEEDIDTFTDIIEICKNNITVDIATKIAMDEAFYDKLSFYGVTYDETIVNKNLLLNFEKTQDIFKNNLENNLLSLGIDADKFNSVLKKYKCVMSGSFVLKSLLCQEWDDNKTSDIDIFVNIKDFADVNMKLCEQDMETKGICQILYNERLPEELDHNYTGLNDRHPGLNQNESEKMRNIESTHKFLYLCYLYKWPDEPEKRVNKMKYILRELRFCDNNTMKSMNSDEIKKLYEDTKKKVYMSNLGRFRNTLIEQLSDCLHTQCVKDNSENQEDDNNEDQEDDNDENQEDDNNENQEDDNNEDQEEYDNGNQGKCDHYDYTFMSFDKAYETEENSGIICVQKLQFKNSPVSIDIVYVEIDPIEHINKRFDLDFCKCYYDGEKIDSTHMQSIIDKHSKCHVMTDRNYNRIKKYIKRGFTVDSYIYISGRRGHKKKYIDFDIIEKYIEKGITVNGFVHEYMMHRIKEINYD